MDGRVQLGFGTVFFQDAFIELVFADFPIYRMQLYCIKMSTETSYILGTATWTVYRLGTYVNYCAGLYNCLTVRGVGIDVYVI